MRRITFSFIAMTTHDGPPKDNVNGPILWLVPHDNACEPNADDRHQDDEASQTPWTGLPNADASLPTNGEPHNHPTANEVTQTTTPLQRWVGTVTMRGSGGLGGPNTNVLNDTGSKPSPGPSHATSAPT